MMNAAAIALRLARYGSPAQRQNATVALRTLATTPAIAALVYLALEDSDRAVRSAATAQLAKLASRWRLAAREEVCVALRRGLTNQRTAGTAAELIATLRRAGWSLPIHGDGIIRHARRLWSLGAVRSAADTAPEWHHIVWPAAGGALLVIILFGAMISPFHTVTPDFFFDVWLVGCVWSIFVGFAVAWWSCAPRLRVNPVIGCIFEVVTLLSIALPATLAALLLVSAASMVELFPENGPLAMAVPVTTLLCSIAAIAVAMAARVFMMLSACIPHRRWIGQCARVFIGWSGATVVATALMAALQTLTGRYLGVPWAMFVVGSIGLAMICRRVDPDDRPRERHWRWVARGACAVVAGLVLFGVQQTIRRPFDLRGPTTYVGPIIQIAHAPYRTCFSVDEKSHVLASYPDAPGTLGLVAGPPTNRTFDMGDLSSGNTLDRDVDPGTHCLLACPFASPGQNRCGTVSTALVLDFVLLRLGRASEPSVPTDLVPLIMSIVPSAHAESPTDPMLRVDAGIFWMGCNQAFESCVSSGSVQQLAAEYWIDRTEVTVADYRACMDAHACTAEGMTEPECTISSSDANLPINCVSFAQAVAVCEHQGKRLPTEKEWEKAARGTDGRRYPWGNASAPVDATLANLGERGGEVRDSADGIAPIAPVGRFPSGASPYGAVDMVGNVAEWTASSQDQSPYDGIVRGGGWASRADAYSVSYRGEVPANQHSVNVGVRCAWGAGEMPSPDHAE